MKKILLPLLIILAVTFYSCEKEEVLDLDEENSVNVNGIDGNSSFESKTTTTSSIELQKQWFAYLIAQTLLADNDAKIYFNTNFVNNSNVIQVSDLFYHSDPYNPWANLFRKEFNLQYLSYYFDNACENQTRTQPTSRPGLGTPPGSTSGDRLGSYLSVISNLEIYLPNSHNVFSSEIKSSADTATGLNEGFLHIAECNVVNTTVSDKTNGNVIIVRSKSSY